MMGKFFFVSPDGNDTWTGCESAPFKTIQRAADEAEAGDTVVVHGGIYSEWVKPPRGGFSNDRRITYRAADNERPVIKGSEEVSGWMKMDGVWQIKVDNALFGGFNPFAVELNGDWLVRPAHPFLHLGAVYRNGRALKEQPELRCVTETPDSYYASVDASSTVITANFAEDDPNASLTEINVRPACFLPVKTGRNYITVRGFEMAHAATQWAPPTADQPGMIGPYWSKGWIIEDNVFHDSRCCAVSLGKEYSTGENDHTRYCRKSGYNHQLEDVMLARGIGWAKERIGSHTVRRNTIYSCGQCGIVGHLGGAFCHIYGNNISHIADQDEFWGHEIACIKLHAAIDTVIEDNFLHDSFRGIWLDWEAQGTRVSRNLFLNNSDTDLFVEVSHGPFIVDNNIFGSKHNYLDAAQGGAFLFNLFCGAFSHHKVLNRFTPYHLPHTTEVLGVSPVYGGDHRFYGNVFTSNPDETEPQDRWHYGTTYYNGSITFEEFEQAAFTELRDHPGGDFVPDLMVMYMGGNAYFDGVPACDCDTESRVYSSPSNLKIENDEGRVVLSMDVPETYTLNFIPATESLPAPRMSGAPFENPDGTEYKADSDYFGHLRAECPTVGPFEKTKPGRLELVLWEKDAKKMPVPRDKARN